VIGAFGVYCALTANASRVSDIVPTLVGTLVAMGAMFLLWRAAHPRPATSNKPAAALADRRLFLQTSAGVAALAALAGFGGRAAQHARFDVAGDRAKVTLPPPDAGAAGQAAKPAKTLAVPRGADLGKSGVPWRTPNGDFYRIDTALTIPQIAPDSWQLKVHGMVDKPISISYKDLLARPQVQEWITLNCVSNEVGGNLISNSLFEGALLADLLREAGISPDCDQLLMSSSDGMTIGAPTKVVMDGRKALLAVGMNGEPLPLEHGFPVRVVVPGLYGYVSACKWVVDIEATTFAAHAAYWVQGGWATAPPIKMSSRIDTPKSGQVLSVGSPTAIAGVAWDQHVGIAKVEVQVNDGAWQSARLASVPSVDTWRQWVFAFTPQQSGSYTLRVRATDKSGQVQDSTVRDVFPSGSTGYDSVSVHANV
jgi:DMSO/TMAO reductase YedYZ molybdopterin-dependent catalytic subunit